MKSSTCALAMVAMLLSFGALAADVGVTYEKISYVARNCGSLSGFASWLETKAGVTDVQSSSIFLTSLPPKNDVRFKLRGEPHSVRVTPDLSFSRLEAAYDVSTGREAGATQSDEAQYKARIAREVRILDRLLELHEKQKQARHPGK